MRIYFGFDWELNPKQSVKNLMCRYKGHVWEKYEDTSSSLMSYMIFGGIPEKQCSRCGKEKYRIKEMKGLRELARISNEKED